MKLIVLRIFNIMKINTLYGLSKIYLLVILLAGLIASVAELIFLGTILSWPFFQLILSLLGISFVLKVKKGGRFFRLLCLFVILPIVSYLTLNFITDVLSTLLSRDYISNQNSARLTKIIQLSYYYLVPINFMIAYKYEILDQPKNGGKVYVPEILSLVVQVLLFGIPTLIVLSSVFGFQLTSILATSGVLAAVIGLAIQANLSNMLSGVFVNIERPFSPNEWVTIDDKTGVVTDVTWRSTRIRTFENTEVTIPNELVASSVITNWSRNDKERMSEGFHIFNTLSFHPKHDPQHISQLLQNALKKVKPVDGRTELDLQWVKFTDVNEYGLKFAIAFDCLDRKLKNSQQNIVLLEVHKTLQHAGIGMSVGRLSTILEEDAGFHALKSNSREPEDFQPEFYGEFNPYNEAIKNKVLLQKVPIFMSMNESEINIISENCKRVHFNSNDVIIKQDDPGDSLFIIADGVVSVQLNQPSGKGLIVSKLGVGDFFGEMSLMTGEPRTANVIAESPTVALSVEKSVIKEVFSKNPRVSDLISDILARRKVALDQIKLTSKEELQTTKNIALEIKNAIVKFLS